MTRWSDSEVLDTLKRIVASLDGYTCQVLKDIEKSYP